MSNIRIELETSRGSIHLTLLADQTPVTCANFLNLAQRGYYNGLKFHRVIADFMVQGGCPQGIGSGGPGYKFEDECLPALKFDRAGLLAMANSGPRTNGSQFFITHVPTAWLNGKHTIFGTVTQGQDIVDTIKGGDKIISVKVLDDTADLMKAQAARVAEWNKVLD
jgi:peptidyl-prolyl cis-trans isomerase B (cyclophilin B)